MDKLEKDKIRYNELFWEHRYWWADEVIALEKYWDSKGMLSELMKPIKKKERQYKKLVLPTYKKNQQYKFYNHIGTGLDHKSWKLPTRELDELEDEFVWEQLEYFINR